MKLRILVLEDDDTHREAVAGFLRHARHDVAAIAGNDEALGLLTKSPESFDLIVQDLRRPPGRCLAGSSVSGDLTYTGRAC